MKPSILLIFVIAAIALSCAQSYREIWYSSPSVQEVSKATYTIRVEPLKYDDIYYAAFLLHIQNKSAHAIELDWNATRYLHNGTDLGVFVFKGIDPEKIQGAIPSDSIDAGQTFSKEISPLRTIAFLPGDQLPEPGRRGFKAGILPAGENAIRVVLSQNGQLRQEILKVRLSSQKEQP